MIPTAKNALRVSKFRDAERSGLTKLLKTAGAVIDKSTYHGATDATLYIDRIFRGETVKDLIKVLKNKKYTVQNQSENVLLISWKDAK